VYITDERLMDDVCDIAPKKIYVANNESVQLNRSGKLNMNVDGHQISFSNALAAPQFGANLLSVPVITRDNKGQVLFVGDRAFVVKDLKFTVSNNQLMMEEPAQIVFTVPRQGDLYVLTK